MDKENNHNEIDQASEDALRLFEQSGAENHATVKRMLDNSQCASVCEDLWLVKNSMERHNLPAPDVEAEWYKFFSNRMTAARTPHNHRTFIWGAVSGIAASLAVMLSVMLWNNLSDNNIMVYKATDAPVEITLQTSDDDSIVLDNKADGKLVGLSDGITRTDSSIIYSNHRKAGAKMQNHVLSTSRGTTFKVELSDGTMVWLNANSSLSYSSHFEGRERRVSLVGEAYFQVAKNDKMPFIVETNSLTTRVLGTEFNIRTGSREASHVTLLKGSVDVVSKNSKQSLRLKPGEDAAIDSNGTIRMQNIDTDVYSYWKEGYFYYDNTTAEDILKSLGEWYNVNIVFRNPKAMHHRMHYFCNRNGSIAEAIELFNHIGKVRAIVDGNTVFVE